MSGGKMAGQMVRGLRIAAVALYLGAGGATQAARAADELPPIPETETVTLNLWLTRAESGSATAQYTVGYMYAMGRGTKQNYVEAEKWFRRAGEQGHARALFSVGLLYENGWGVNEDKAEAMAWYRRAAEKGDPGAETNVAYNYFNGIAVAQDYAEAFKWYRRAALHGSSEPQYGLAGMYEVGLGVAQDYVRAFMWYGVAAAGGDQAAGRARRRVAEKLSDDEIREGDQMARRCMESGLTACE